MGVWVSGNPQKTFQIDQKMRDKFQHLLMPISSAPLDVEKSYEQKTARKMDSTWAKIAWVKKYRPLVCSSDSIRLFNLDFEIELSKLDRGPFDHSGRKLTRSDLFWFSFLGMKRDDPTNKINPP